MSKHGARTVRGYVRFPRTTQEKKMNEAHIEYVRGKRRPNCLPDAWDDISSQGLYYRCWKNRFKKKHQWDKKPLKRTYQLASWNSCEWYKGFVFREMLNSNGSITVDICREGSKFAIITHTEEKNRYWKRYTDVRKIIDDLVDKGIGYNVRRDVLE